MNSVWLLQHSRDGGLTWELQQPYHLYKRRETAQEAVRRWNGDGHRICYRAIEYRPVQP